MPADGLFRKRLPPDKDVVGRFAGQDRLQLLLQILSSLEPQVGPGLACFRVGDLGGDPVAEVGVCQVFQRFVIQFVVVDQSREAILSSVPNMPDERAMLKPLAVLIEELVAEPVVKRGPRLTPRLGQQFVQNRIRPSLPVGRVQHFK